MTTLEEETCSVCEGLSDKECLSALDDEYDAMSDKVKLSYLRDAYPEYDTSLTDKECLAALEAELSAETDKNRLSLLKDACVAYSAATAATTAVTSAMTTLEEETCSVCEGLSDKECLSALDDEYDAMSDKVKLSYLR